MTDQDKRLRTKHKNALSRGPTKAEHAALVAERRELARKGGGTAVQPVRDVLVAKGYDAVSRLLPKVIARLEEAVENKNDPLHERAMDILSKRAVPIAFYESLAKQEFRPDEEQNRSPQIVINVTGTAGIEAVQQVGRRDDVVDVEAEERDE